MTPPLPSAPHILTKIAESTATLKGSGTAQEMVDALSWLIHLIGDIHQPLHCVTHITSQHPAPEGDRGGNSFKLKGTPNNLHSVWDSSVSFQHNLDDSALASSIIQEHSRQLLAGDLKVTLTYEQHRYVPTNCFGETEYYVTAVQVHPQQQ